ncbi:protein phosphatase 2C domain-containing protein [Streptomyces sp. NPDC058308]|uniref:protein phosphatase 2C domain-containing protein n=1 Tax=Streptomyces sp. NPDC058308 TaxID=3346440 RepID=UPI0036F13250
MSQQGDRPTGRDDDWWGQLYDDSAPDTGPAPAPDTLDDRFASAADALQEGFPAQRAPGRGDSASRDAVQGDPASYEPGPDAPAQRDPAPRAPEPRPPTTAPPTAAPPSTPPRPPGPAAGPFVTPDEAPPERPAPRRQPQSGAPPEPPEPPDPPEPPGPPDQPDPPQPLAPPRRPPAQNGRASRQAPDHKRADPAGPPTFVAPAPWAPPPAAPSGPVTFPAGGPGKGSAYSTPSTEAPRGDESASYGPDDAARRRGPDGGPGASGERREETVPPGGTLAYVGDGPPTYEAEPTVLPAADPDDLGDLVADTVLDGARYGTSTLRAASVRGDSARYRGEPRRDSLLTARFGSGEDSLVLVAMATGARATPGAHRAAAEACAWIGRAVGRSHRRLAEDIRAARRGDLKSGLHRLTDRSLGKLRARAVDLGLEPEEYAASLRCLLLPADPRCRTRVFFGVGTGGLFRLRGGEWQDIEPRVADATGDAVVGFGSLPAQSPEGDHLTMDLGITTPPSPYEPAPEPPREPFRFRASVARPGDALVLCSGGLAEPLRGEPELAEHLTRRWEKSGPPGLAAFLADVQVRVKGYADDRTAAAVWEA